MTALALTASEVYALYVPPSGQGGVVGSAATMLARIDRASGAVRVAGPFPGAAALAAGARYVWIGFDGEASGAQSSVILRLDSATISDGLSFSLPPLVAGDRAVANIAASDSGVWLAYDRNVYELDQTTGRTLHRAPVAGRATSIALDPAAGRLYVGADVASPDAEATVTEWDAATLNQRASAATGGGTLGGPRVAASGDDVWIAYATGMLGQVEHRRTSDLASLPMSTDLRATNNVAVFTAAGYVWVTDGMAGRLACLDPVTGAVRASSELVNGGIVVGDSAGIYVGGMNGVAVLTPDPGC